MSDPKSFRFAILALALGAFAIGTSEFAAMGLLPWYASDLGVTEPEAGHVVSVYALGVVVGAPITTILGARLPRRRYLAALIAIYGAMNLLAAVLPGYSSLVGARFLAGLPHGGFLGAAMLFAADALPKEQRARGVTQVMLGLMVANIIGVPLAGLLGQGLGWRWGFALPGVVALIAAVVILRFAPRGVAPPDVQPMQELHALVDPPVILMLLVGAIGTGGVFSVYAFLSAAMLATTTPPVWGVALALAMFGVGGTFGSIFSARLTIRLGVFRAAFLLMLFMAATQGFSALCVGNWWMMVLSSLALGLGTGLVVPLQTRLMDVAGQAQSMAAAMNHAAFNMANALGPWLAGIALTAGFGWWATGVVGMALTLTGMAVLFIAWLQSRGQGIDDLPGVRTLD
ncbi:MFS transporter [Paenirhodobacter populi]|uniref:MFS transporter n=1 Tax=Paenirhodobacter populi TaxID=2306993 RepID=A0A443JKS1_9RHOB|nr:MFS transporter [Sinirhodobacter populi]RWR04217.1 MFS transporter [Sinirhodobacter populi]RWR11076.1 MFS transporter [Sinirhodobacter populi]RWR21172.1 MFS transporter [Sinirhodobacter populi]RWR32572.1 MFS transporter [Sinirhodobacter populi]